jgi:hypothetical protein
MDELPLKPPEDLKPSKPVTPAPAWVSTDLRALVADRLASSA